MGGLKTLIVVANGRMGEQARKWRSSEWFGAKDATLGE